jgi:hypothetical protein
VSAPVSEEPILAPCVAVVGPANSGKTSLLHPLDEALQSHPSAPLAYVVKGNPDGTGRYLLHAPELRERGVGSAHAHVCRTVLRCRASRDRLRAASRTPRMQPEPALRAGGRVPGEGGTSRPCER